MVREGWTGPGCPGSGRPCLYFNDHVFLLGKPSSFDAAFKFLLLLTCCRVIFHSFHISKWFNSSRALSTVKPFYLLFITTVNLLLLLSYFCQFDRLSHRDTKKSSQQPKIRMLILQLHFLAAKGRPKHKFPKASAAQVLGAKRYKI